MLDAARLPEPLPYYRQVVDFCAAWGFNAILLRVTDDQGSALRFESHPELLTHRHAFTPAELGDLARYAQARGVDLIPELEAFGHTGFITASPRYAHLKDDQPGSATTFTGVQPLHPDSMAVLADLIAEAGRIFPSHYLHLGCDEVNWGGSDYSRALIAERGRAGVWSAHLNQLNALAREAGKEMMIWADHVLVHEPEILAGLSREIILVDWNYWDTSPDQPAPGAHRALSIAAAAQRALEAGFRLVGAPALTWCRWNLRPGAMQLDNIDAFAAAYHALRAPANLGLIVTNWVPSRYLPAALWDGAAYAGQALSSPGGIERGAAFERFAAEHFGTAGAGGWADFYADLYAAVRPRQPCGGPALAPFQAPIWAGPEDLAALPPAQPGPLAALDALLAQAARLENTVRQNAGDFAALRLSMELLAHIERRALPEIALAAGIAAGSPTAAGSTAAAGSLPGEESGPGAGGPRRLAGLPELAAQDARHLYAYTQEWDRLRFPNCPAKTALLPTLSPADQPLYALAQAAAFTARLAEGSGEE